MPPANPAATGSAGSAFETKVAAACLTLLLTRGEPLCLGSGTLRAVHLQAGHLHLGWHTDDILLEAADSCGKSMKAALQVKRSFVLSATDPECIQTVRGAFSDFRNSGQFDQQRDAVAVVTSSLSAALARGLRSLLDCARASPTADDMARRLAIPNYLGKPSQRYHEIFTAILAGVEGGLPSRDEIWRFLRRFHVVDLDLNIENGFTETMLRTLLTATQPDQDASIAGNTWNEFVKISLSDAGRAMSYTRETLPENLKKYHGKATGFSRGISRLLDDSAVVISSIRTTIAEKTVIPRRELFEELCSLIEASTLVFVAGAAGSGKSALVKSAFQVITQGRVGFAFRADSLAGGHINDVLSSRGLTIRDLQAQTVMHGKKMLWVDSLERLMEKPPEQRAAFLDLLRELKLDPSWCLVVTCRDYSAETVRTVFFKEVGLIPGDLNVGDLSDDELDQVAADSPHLERLLSSKSLRNLLRNPFFLDKAAKMNWPESEPLPTTERAFREKVWREVIRRVDEDVESGLPNLRGRTLSEVALRRAKALEPFVPADDLDSRALARLVRDSLLQTPFLGSGLYAPAHDVFEDWALMHWLDDSFARKGKTIELLLGELGTHPALRRAYRRWLTESLDSDPQATDSIVLKLIQNPVVAAHWREDTLVGVLQSRDANDFIGRNAALLLAADAKHLRQVVHILRVACRAVIPRRLFGLESDGEFFLPSGNGWIGASRLMELAIPLFKDEDLLWIVGFLEDWILLTRYGVLYPPGASSIAAIAWHYLPKIPWRCPVRDAEERLLRVILAVPLAAEPKLTTRVEEGLRGEAWDRSDKVILDLIFSHFSCDAAVRDLPDLCFRVAEQLLGLNQTLEEVVAHDQDDHWSREVQHAFGFGRRHSFEDFPSSAYHGPYLRMLERHPRRGVDFILQMINRAGDAYSHPDNRCEHIEPPGFITLQLPDGKRVQHANWRLWAAYRGMHVAPNCLESALMALEHWLLEKARRGDGDLQSILMELLDRTNNVSITAVVASIAAAKPLLAGEASYALLTCQALLKSDLHRSVQEPFLLAQLGGLGALNIRPENQIYDRERKESARLEHRLRHLEHVAMILQTTESFRERVWTLIDRYKSELAPESEQDREDKIWRIQLHRIDIRNFIEAGRTEEGHILMGSSEPAPDLQALIEEQEPRSAAVDTAIALLNWGMAVFEGKSVGDDWLEQLEKAQRAPTMQASEVGESILAEGGPVYVAAVCIRDHWSEMSAEQAEWCAMTVCNSIETDADTSDPLAVREKNPAGKSRPAAFVLSALFGKPLLTETEDRLLPTLAKAVMHPNEETVTFAMRGVARFLWSMDRALALTCVNALVVDAAERDAFVERRNRQRFSEWEAEEPFYGDLRRRLRKFISHRGSVEDGELTNINCAVWPGRSVAKHLFEIAVNNPQDPLIRIIMEKNAALLPAIWYSDEHARGSRRGLHYDKMRYDAHLEHDFVDALCRYALTLDPAASLVFLDPVFLAAPHFPEKGSRVVTWLILHQGDRVPAKTLWSLWQRFADDFVPVLNSTRADEENSEEVAMLRALFLGENWGLQRDWLPLHGETQRLRDFFLRLPPLRQVFACYAYYLAKAGTPTLPDALTEVSIKLAEYKGMSVLNESAVFYLEEILSRLIYGGDSRIRFDSALREATLAILDALVAAGSSPAYKLRDDFLTPVA